MGYKLVNVQGGTQLVEVQQFDRNVVKNVATYFVSNDRLLVLIANVPNPTRPLFTGLSVPGGGIEPTDATVFQAMKREWREEMGADLPDIDIDMVRRYVWNGSTAIYVIKASPKDRVKYDHNRVHRFNFNKQLAETEDADFKKLGDIERVLRSTTAGARCDDFAQAQDSKLAMQVPALRDTVARTRTTKHYCFRPMLKDSTLAVIAEVRRLGWDK